MIQRSKKLLSIALLATLASTLHADPNISTGTPYFFTRSQSRNKVLQVAGEVGHTDLYDINSCYGTFDVVIAYERSFRSNRISDALFGPVGTGTLCQTTCNTKCTTSCVSGRTFNIQGSGVVGRDPNAWLAEYFYLPTDFSSTISFKPRITNTLIFLDYFQGLDDCLCGAYFRIYGPITFSRWDLNFCENVINRGTTGYVEGYFTPSAAPLTGPFTAVPANTLLNSFSSYALGDTPQGLILPGGVNPQPLKYAKIRRESHKKTGFADLRFELGWDFWQTECYHLGINIQGAAPTGSRPDADFLFQPVVGNGKHWELGGGVTGHYNLWMNATETKIFSFWFDANITHLFAAHQQRTFDLRNKPVSRYMLAERLGTPVTGLFANTTGGGAAGGVAPALQFQGEYAPVANLTTTDIKVSIDVQADVVAWFNLLLCNWSLDVGYNFWGTSCEKIRLDECQNDCKNLISLCNANQTSIWALKGDAQMYGFQAGGATTGTALSATESGASITGGTNMAVGAPVNSAASTNAGIDNPQFAQATATGTELFAPNLTTQIRTSFQPVTLSCADINFTRNKGLTHKVFVHLARAWECACVIPYLGIGGSAEFAQRTDKDCCPLTCPSSNTSCKTKGNCMRSAASLWSVWLKGGVSF